MIIREELPEDVPAIYRVNELAFGKPGEAELVNSLRAGGLVCLSLVAVVDDRVTGHLLFSRIGIKSVSGVREAWSLAPMAVLPEYQNRGIGSRLVREGLQLSKERGCSCVLVLGHPHFYSKFGFSAEQAQRYESVFGGGESWMAIEQGSEPASIENCEVLWSPPFMKLL